MSIFAHARAVDMCAGVSEGGGGGVVVRDGIVSAGVVIPDSGLLPRGVLDRGAGGTGWVGFLVVVEEVGPQFEMVERTVVVVMLTGGLLAVVTVVGYG